MNVNDSDQFLLAGDVGGTKTDLGLFKPGRTRPRAIAIESYDSRNAPSLEHLIEKFLAKHHASVSSACFGIAGPVLRGVSKATNLPWVVSERRIAKRFSWSRVWLVNDLSATARALPALKSEEFAVINKGKPGNNGTLGVVAPGTGLGMALAVFREGKMIVIPSEGGHVDFAPRNALEMELLRYLLAKRSHVSVERVVSGPGLHTIYKWLRTYRRKPAPAWLTEKMAHGNPAAAISAAALDEADEICVESLDLFVSMLGAIAGNLALTATTLGGMYLGGGVPPKILPKLLNGPFMEGFATKGRFRPLIEGIPVRVILNDKAALLGAACFAQDAAERVQ